MQVDADPHLPSANASLSTRRCAPLRNGWAAFIAVPSLPDAIGRVNSSSCSCFFILPNFFTHAALTFRLHERAVHDSYVLVGFSVFF
jgi:hypothetical protein